MKPAYRRLFLQILLAPVLPVFAKGGDTTPKETAQEKALAEVAAKQYRDYRQNGVPLENAMIQRTDMQAPDYENVQGQANAEMQKAGDELKQQRIATTTKSGADASSGAVVMGMADDANKLASAAAAAGVKAGQAVEDRGLAGKQQMIAVGRGQATDAMESMREQASTAARTAIEDRQLQTQSSQATGAGIGTAAGMITAAATDPTKKKSIEGGV